MKKNGPASIAFIGLFSLIAFGGISQTPQPKPDTTSMQLMIYTFEQTIVAITPSPLDDDTALITNIKKCINTTDFPTLEALFKQTT